MGIVINYCENYEEMSWQAAEIVAGEIKSKENFVLGLPTGSTPLGMYENLIEMNKSGKTDFSKITTFNLDEYYPIKRDNSQSYYKFMFDNFFGKININPENINIPDGEATDAKIECGTYDQKINHAGGIDLMVIGIGPNGHIGFNEPGNFLLPNTHVAVLTEETKEANKRFFDSVNEVPDRALTMGMGSIIAKSKKILMLVSGKSKANAFRQFLEGKITSGNPATFLYLHNNIIVLSDIEI
ncbi:MAG: glucosamine-6-phosphate deaminase [Oscillospiraceae bacterium]|nr:glucosamine-6-phosphate deaminase [Oscillospiraceae bacterium]